MNEEQLKELISKNTEFIKLLRIIEKLELNDCWLCAGTIRNFVWDILSRNKNPYFMTDIDVVFFDENITYEETVILEDRLKKDYPEYDWELKNQVYMHIHNPSAAKYKSSYDAISKFPETCTAIGIRILDNQLKLISPHGIEDLVNFKVKPTPFFKENTERMMTYKNRVKNKKWQQRWPNIIIELT